MTYYEWWRWQGQWREYDYPQRNLYYFGTQLLLGGENGYDAHNVHDVVVVVDEGVEVEEMQEGF